MAVSTIQPVPSYALPFIGNEEALRTLGLRFNPQWLKWFLDMIQDLQTGGAIDHNLLANLQGGSASQFYHLTSAQAAIITGTKTANTLYAGPASGAAAIPAFRALVTADLPAGTGTVTSVASGFTGGLISVAGSPITTSGTLAFTVAGTSGGIPYFASAASWASSAVLGAGQIVYGGGAGSAPASSAAWTFDGTSAVTLGGNAVATPQFTLNGTAGTAKVLEFQSAGAVKWDVYSVATSHDFAIDTTSLRAMTITQTGAVSFPVSVKIGTQPTYTLTNVTTDRSYDANATTLDEVADTLGTLVADLRTMGLVL